MYRDLLEESSHLYPILLHLDRELARQARKGGCLFCGGKLHQANYPRKPRGAPVAGDPAYCVRHSFCCAAEGCRRRHTPASVLFLRRKVFFAAVVVLSGCLHQGPSRERLEHLCKLTGASLRTLKRWLKWWRVEFVESAFWRGHRGLFARPVCVASLPHSLLCSFLGEARDQLVSLLRFLGPLTSRTAHGSLDI